MGENERLQAGDAPPSQVGDDDAFSGIEGARARARVDEDPSVAGCADGHGVALSDVQKDQLHGAAASDERGNGPGHQRGREAGGQEGGPHPGTQAQGEAPDHERVRGQGGRGGHDPPAGRPDGGAGDVHHERDDGARELEE